MSRITFDWYAVISRFPRSRGDEPWNPQLRVYAQEFSPLTRG